MQVTMPRTPSARRPAPEPTLANAVAAIERHGVMLVYPVKNVSRSPHSLWAEFYPRRTMRWAWDASADPRVAEIWHLRERIARSKKVVYSKWLTGRATFFSKPAFQAILACLMKGNEILGELSRTSRELYEILSDDSPQPTGALRERAGLEGRFNEAELNRAIKPLWSRMLIVGTGEVEERGFPSLAIGTTELIHEPLWLKAKLGPMPSDAELLSDICRREPSVDRAISRVLSTIPEIDWGVPRDLPDE
jgi:hypothetical protein